MGQSSEQVRELKDKGAQLLAKGKFKAALDAFQEAVRVAPTDASAHQKLAECLQRLDRRADAVLAWERVAALLAREGLLLRAIAVCKVILELEPKHARTQQLLADLYAQRRGTAPASAPGAPKPSTSNAVAPTKPLPPASPTHAVPHQARSVSGEFDVHIEVQAPVAGSSSSGSEPSPFPLFSSLDKDAFVAVLDGMEVRVFEPGQAIVNEGEHGRSMFAVVEGRVDVVRQFDDRTLRVVAQMGDGEFFGEIALLSDAPRLATVRAATKTIVLEFTRDRMEEIVAKHPQVGEVMQAFYRERLLANVLRSNPLFAPLNAQQRSELARAFIVRTAAPGELLIEHGKRGDSLFLLLRGRCLPFHPAISGRETRYPEMREGDIFGEISLLLDKPATASVRAEVTSTLLTLSRGEVDKLLATHPQLRSELMKISFERLQRTAKLLSGRLSHPGDTRV